MERRIAFLVVMALLFVGLPVSPAHAAFLMARVKVGKVTVCRNEPVQWYIGVTLGKKANGNKSYGYKKSYALRMNFGDGQHLSARVRHNNPFEPRVEHSYGESGAYKWLVKVGDPTNSGFPKSPGAWRRFVGTIYVRDCDYDNSNPIIDIIKHAPDIQTSAKDKKGKVKVKVPRHPREDKRLTIFWGDGHKKAVRVPERRPKRPGKFVHTFRHRYDRMGLKVGEYLLGYYRVVVRYNWRKVRQHKRFMMYHLC